MKDSYIRTLRLFFGLLGLAAVLTEMVVTSIEGTFNPIYFFSYFTILSNIAAGIVLIYLACNMRISPTAQVVRGAVTLYMAMTGVIFAFLLAGLQNVRLTAVPWDNIVLHYIMPIVMVVDWLIFPPQTRVSLKRAVLWLLFPIAYVIFTLVRGGASGWYPYPFFNPAFSSLGQVIATCVIISIFVIIAMLLLRLRARRAIH